MFPTLKKSHFRVMVALLEMKLQLLLHLVVINKGTAHFRSFHHCHWDKRIHFPFFGAKNMCYQYDFARHWRVPVCEGPLQKEDPAGAYVQIYIMFLHKFQGFLSNFIYRGSHVLDYYLFPCNFNHFRAKKTPKKAFFFSCNFSYIRQPV